MFWGSAVVRTLTCRGQVSIDFGDRGNLEGVGLFKVHFFRPRRLSAMSCLRNPTDPKKP